MAEPARRFWTLDEFLAFGDGEDRRYELFDGRIVAMAPASDVHGALVGRLDARMGRAGSRGQSWVAGSSLAFEHVL